MLLWHNFVTADDNDTTLPGVHRINERATANAVTNVLVRLPNSLFYLDVFLPYGLPFWNRDHVESPERVKSGPGFHFNFEQVLILRPLIVDR